MTFAVGRRVSIDPRIEMFELLQMTERELVVDFRPSRSRHTGSVDGELGWSRGYTLRSTLYRSSAGAAGISFFHIGAHGRSRRSEEQRSRRRSCREVELELRSTCGKAASEPISYLACQDRVCRKAKKRHRRMCRLHGVPSHADFSQELWILWSILTHASPRGREHLELHLTSATLVLSNGPAKYQHNAPFAWRAVL